MRVTMFEAGHSNCKVKLFFLPLILLRGICYQVSNQADQFDLVEISLFFLALLTFRPPIQMDFLRAMFFNHV